jgi:16S rRNA U516 pseudouridylate synthase RsuA-like enzyme
VVKRIVVAVAGAARGYVDGRFVGEEKDGDGGRGRKRRGAGAAADSVLGAAGIAVNRKKRSGQGKGSTQGKVQGAGQGRGKAQGQARGAGKGRSQGAREQGNVLGEGQGQGQGQGQGRRRGQGAGQGAGGAQAVGQAQRRPRAQGQPRTPGQAQGQRQGQGQRQARGPRGAGAGERVFSEGNVAPNVVTGDVGGNSGSNAGGDTGGNTGVRRGRGGRGRQPRRDGLPLDIAASSFIPGELPADGRRAKPRKNRQGKQTPFRKPAVRDVGARDLNGLRQDHSPTQGADLRRFGDESKSGQFAEALAASANVKRERLHKVMAQSGIGSRRDMEIMISSGRVMVNGIVATAGTQVALGDTVLVDHRPIRLKFTQDLPRVLLYHKPEGEIVTTNDPGNRITVFDNLPRVENGKWIAVGRLDINTSGLLIFTTSGELANRFMHPRYEVEREYAVRILGELTDAQTKNLLGGVEIGDAAADDEDSRGNGSGGGGDGEDDEFEDLDYAPHEEEFIPPVDEFEHELDEVDGNAASKSDVQPDEASVAATPAIQKHFDDEDEDDNRFNTIAAPVKFTPPVRKAPVQPLTPTAHEKRDGLARFDVIEKRGGEGVNQWYHVVIREGRNREVRKMFESQGLTVSRLIRTRFGKIELPPRLLRGNLVELAPDQVRGVLASAGMETDGPIGKLPTHAPRPIHPGRNRDRAAQGGDGAVGGGARTGATGSRPPRNDSERPPRDGRRRRGKPADVAGRGSTSDGVNNGANNGANEFEIPNASGGFDSAAAPVAGVEGEGGVGRNKRRRGRGQQRGEQAGGRGENRGGQRVPRNAGTAVGDNNVAGMAADAANVSSADGVVQSADERGQERRTNPRGRRNFRGRNRRGGGRGGEGGGSGSQSGGESGGGGSGGESQGNS